MIWWAVTIEKIIPFYEVEGGNMFWIALPILPSRVGENLFFPEIY